MFVLVPSLCFRPNLTLPCGFMIMGLLSKTLSDSVLNPVIDPDHDLRTSYDKGAQFHPAAAPLRYNWGKKLQI